MQIGVVIGTVWATRKDDDLSGLKLLVVKPIDLLRPEKNIVPIVAADRIGAGVGEHVLFVGGSSARSAVKNNMVPVDATVVGIIDDLEIDLSALDARIGDT